MDQEIKELTIEDKKEGKDEVDLKEGKKIAELTEVEKQKKVMRRKSDLPQVLLTISIRCTFIRDIRIG